MIRQNLDSVVVSATASTAYLVWDGNGAEFQSVHISGTSAGSGIASATFWASNKPNPDETVDADWGLIDGIAIPQLTSSAPSIVKPISLLPVGKMRIKLERVSGTSFAATGWVVQSGRKLG